MNNKIEEVNKIEKVMENINNLMGILDINKTPENEETPKRIAKMFIRELFSSLYIDEESFSKETLTFFPVHNPNQTVKLKGIKFYSMCEHHWLPFFGEVDIEYVPNKTEIGLSKLPRIVDYFSRKPQVQERLTREIGEFLVHVLDPLKLKVVIRDCTHLCVAMRGIQSPCQTDTEYNYNAITINFKGL